MPDLPDENLYNALNYTFENAVNHVITDGLDFTIESNLRDDEILDTVSKFKQNGYHTSFVFIALGTVEESRSRVDQRIREGGHAVENFSIAYNFEHSKKTLFAIIDKFDKAMVLESLQDSVNPIFRLLYEEMVLEDAKTEWGATLQQQLVAAMEQKNTGR